MRSALSIVEKWCREVELTVNPEKAEAVLFPRKYKTRPVSGLKLFGKEIKVSKSENHKIACRKKRCGKIPSAPTTI